jgi:DNA-directed RNA polymerase specialized sigma24 family protein
MSLTASLGQPALDQLTRHARLFGTECVYETGEQEGLPSADLARLRIELDELHVGRKSKHGFSIGKRRRRSSDETRAAALALSVDGFVPKAIADKLGISDRTVRGYLTQSGATAYDGDQEVAKSCLTVRR